jgi:hypothetical protein
MVSIFNIENPMLPEYINYCFVDILSEFVVIENFLIILTDFGQILNVFKFSDSYKRGEFYYTFDLESKYISLKSRSGKIYLLSSNYQFWEFDFKSWIQISKILNWLIIGGILGGIAVIIIYNFYKKHRNK